MILLGLTGGIGMGKSTAEKFLRARQLPTIDTDQIARDVVLPGEPALAEIVSAFGKAVIGPQGELLRGHLAKIVFADAVARQKLESILHPRIRQRWLATAAQWRASGVPVGIVVIPLLFETGAEKDVDCTLCIACSARTQMERLLTRGMSPDQIHQRVRSQMPVERKIALADYVIWSEGSLDAHHAQLELVLQRARLHEGSERGLQSPQQA